jgi:hypothetical protein
MILFKNENVTVEFDPTIPCAVWTPVGYVYGDDFRDPFLIGIDFVADKIKEYPSIGWLNDVRRIKSPKKEDVEWVNNKANNIAERIGLKKFAFVPPEDVFGKMAIRLYAFMTNKMGNSKLEIKAFATIEEARLWLKGIKGVELNEIKLSINQK